jgi:hypothetical protein
MKRRSKVSGASAKAQRPQYSKVEASKGSDLSFGGVMQSKRAFIDALKNRPIE